MAPRLQGEQQADHATTTLNSVGRPRRSASPMSSSTTIASKPRICQLWKSGDCHSSMNDCCTVLVWVRHEYTYSEKNAG